jgi:hypothetical protein
VETLVVVEYHIEDREIDSASSAIMKLPKFDSRIPKKLSFLQILNPKFATALRARAQTGAHEVLMM